MFVCVFLCGCTRSETEREREKEGRERKKGERERRERGKERERVADGTALFFLPSAPSVAMERQFHSPIGGEINTIFNWLQGLPPCVRVGALLQIHNPRHCTDTHAHTHMYMCNTPWCTHTHGTIRHKDSEL